MWRALTLHPESVCDPVQGIDAVAERVGAGGLALRFRVSGGVDDMVLPSPGPSSRVNGLWEHTCFEAFIRPEGSAAYFELNVASSTAWAAYRFDGYRQGIRDAGGFEPPRVATERDAGTFELTATLDLSQVTELADAAAWCVGLSAVIETGDGGRSYWALAHPPGHADFHHADCFALRLPATERA